MNSKTCFNAAIKVVLVLVCLRSAANAKLESQFGIVDAMPDGQWCLFIANPSLEPHDSVDIILDGSPQLHLAAEIVGKQEKACWQKPQAEVAEFYTLRLKTGHAEAGATGLGIAKSGFSFKHAGGLVGFDSGSETPYYFRTCASAEGLHLTVWKGLPLKGKRVWHRYYYLGYDMEPNCTEADYAEISK